MQASNRPYAPVDCEFQDRLEAFATLRQTIEIVYRDGEDVYTTNDRITDVYLRDRVEYLTLANGTGPIRLDDLVTVDGIALPVPACAI